MSADENIEVENLLLSSNRRLTKTLSLQAKEFHIVLGVIHYKPVVHVDRLLLIFLYPRSLQSQSKDSVQ